MDLADSRLKSWIDLTGWTGSRLFGAQTMGISFVSPDCTLWGVFPSALWEERERQRTEFLLTLDDAKASLAGGEGRVITEQSMHQLAQEVKERGRARLLAELTTTPR